MGGTEYHKLWAPYKRIVTSRNKSHLDTTQWSRPEFELLSEMDWRWTEKVNGTNARIIWDGHRVRIGGRTDEAQLGSLVTNFLRAEFPEELLENQFHGTPAVLYGECYGARVVPGSGMYRSDPGFILFDACVADWWLLPDALKTLAQQMGVDLVPEVLVGGIEKAVAMVTDEIFTSRWGNFQPEGLVGKPPLGLLGRDGDRLMVKIKPSDFE